MISHEINYTYGVLYNNRFKRWIQNIYFYTRWTPIKVKFELLIPLLYWYIITDIAVSIKLYPLAFMNDSDAIYMHDNRLTKSINANLSELSIETITIK